MNRQQEIVRVFLDGSAQDKLKINLKEQGESVRIVVAYVGRGKDKLKLDYQVNHLAPETKSEIFVCGVLAGQAQKELNMTIDFRRGCVNAKGEEREDVLLLSDAVVNNAQPVIYCEEESVLGTHGASVGRLSDEAINYLMSRGLTLRQARTVLMRAKLMQVVGKISDTKKANSIAERLEQALEGLVKYNYGR